MCAQGFKRSSFDPCVYIKHVSYEIFGFVILVYYMNDMLIATKDRSEVDKLKSLLSSEFRMKDLGTFKRILEMEIHWDRNGKLWLTQGKCARKVLARFNMENCKPVSTSLASHFKLSSVQCPTDVTARRLMSKITYSKAVESLMYLMIFTRLDIAMTLGKVSMSNLGKMHWEAMKWILRYLKGTMDYGLLWCEVTQCQILDWLCGRWLWTRSLWKEIYNGLCIYTWRWVHKLEVYFAEVRSLVYFRGRVCGSNASSEGSYLVR